MVMDIFKNPSTFTWIGRHASELRFLVDSLDKPPETVLDVGGGIFEPFYLARMLPQQSRLYLVDVDQKVYEATRILNCGEVLSLPYLSSIACNKNDNTGNPQPNTDLTDPNLLKQGFHELEMAGVKDTFYTDDHLGEIWLHGDVPVIGIERADAREYLSQHRDEFGFVYAGIVLMNMAKVLSREELISVSRDLVASVKPNGVLGIGETPIGLYGEKGVPTSLEEGGAVLTDLLIDNVVQSRGKLRGGHCLRFVRPDNRRQYSPISSQEIDERISRDQLLARADVKRREVEGASLGPYLRRQSKTENNRLLVAALRRDGGYNVWEAPMAKVMEVTPPTRRTLSLLPGLKYTKESQ